MDWKHEVRYPNWLNRHYHVTVNEPGMEQRMITTRSHADALTWHLQPRTSGEMRTCDDPVCEPTRGGEA